MKKMKEAAKFLSGAAAWASLVHFLLWYFKPGPPFIYKLQISYDPDLSSIAIPAAVSVILAVYAWKK